MRVVFCGTPALAVPTLAAVAEEHDVAAVVCQPDRPRGRSKRPVAPPVKEWAQACGLTVHQPEKLTDGAFEHWLRELAVDVGVLVAYGRILKTPILRMPAEGWLNMHPSLLPRWRGPSPIQSALLAGDTETGVTIMRLSEEMDAGDLLLQERTEVPFDEDHIQLSDRLAKQGAAMMVQGLAQLASGTATFQPQDHDKATYCSLIRKEDGRIAWSRDAWSIHNQVRACVPWPVAHCLYNDAVFRILATRPEEGFPDADPGTVVETAKDDFTVATGRGVLRVLSVQASGKRIMETREFLAGHRLSPGTRFQEVV